MEQSAQEVVLSPTDRFIEKAKVAAARVSRIKNFAEAIAYTVDLCGKQGACRLKVSGCDEHLTEQAEELCETKHGKIIAAPALESADFDSLAQACKNNGFSCIDSGIRSQLAGVDIGFTLCDIGIAETGTVVINCPDEELRLATMICEYHICVLKESDIVVDAFAAEAKLNKFMNQMPNYTAFITGPSRTADIERVLTIGVHGPLELHVLVLED